VNLTSSVTKAVKPPNVTGSEQAGSSRSKKKSRIRSPSSSPTTGNRRPEFRAGQPPEGQRRHRVPFRWPFEKRNNGDWKSGPPAGVRGDAGPVPAGLTFGGGENTPLAAAPPTAVRAQYRTCPHRAAPEAASTSAAGRRLKAKNAPPTEIGGRRRRRAGATATAGAPGQGQGTLTGPVDDATSDRMSAHKPVSPGSGRGT